MNLWIKQSLVRAKVFCQYAQNGWISELNTLSNISEPYLLWRYHWVTHYRKYTKINHAKEIKTRHVISMNILFSLNSKSNLITYSYTSLLRQHLLKFLRHISLKWPASVMVASIKSRTKLFKNTYIYSIITLVTHVLRHMWIWSHHVSITWH